MSAPAPLAAAATSSPAARRHAAELEVAESVATLATRARSLLAAINDIAPASEDPRVEAARVLACPRSVLSWAEHLHVAFRQLVSPFRSSPRVC